MPKCKLSQGMIVVGIITEKDLLFSALLMVAMALQKESQSCSFSHLTRRHRESSRSHGLKYFRLRLAEWIQIGSFTHLNTFLYGNT